MRAGSTDRKDAAKAAGASDSCDGKKRFSNWDRAEFAAKNIRRHKRARLASYHCRRCSGFHIGGTHV